MNDLARRMIRVGIALTSTRDLDRLLDIILAEARALTGADAGSIYLARENRLWFCISHNQTLFSRHGEEETGKLFREFDIPMDGDSIAGYCAAHKKALNLADVYDIPADFPFRFNRYWDRANNYRSKSMLAAPMLNTAGEVVGVVQLINAKDKKGDTISFSRDMEEVLTSFASEAAVAIENARLTEQLRDAHLETVFRLGVAAEYRDKETANHIRRVCEYSRIVGERSGLDQEGLEVLYWAAAMHDVGKLGVPDAILHKPDALTSEERRVMQYHTLIGAKILEGAGCDLLQAAQVVALTHHERFDGTGYPQGIRGEEIPLFGRIVALADVFDALSSRRVYKAAFPEEKVLCILKEESGAHFDPRLVDNFLQAYELAREVQDRYPDREEDLNKFKNLEQLTPGEIKINCPACAR